jgi:hypothetical protein
MGHEIFTYLGSPPEIFEIIVAAGVFFAAWSVFRGP